MKEGIITIALLQAMDECLKTGKPVGVADILNRHQLQNLSTTF
jgi:hypothetical protein